MSHDLYTGQGIYSKILVGTISPIIVVDLCACHTQNRGNRCVLVADHMQCRDYLRSSLSGSFGFELQRIFSLSGKNFWTMSMVAAVMPDTKRAIPRPVRTLSSSVIPQGIFYLKHDLSNVIKRTQTVVEISGYDMLSLSGYCYMLFHIQSLNYRV